MPPAASMQTEPELIAVCAALIDPRDDLCTAEHRLLTTASGSLLVSEDIAAARQAILDGGDPLGDAFSSIRSAVNRRTTGAVYTPHLIVDSMMHWLTSQGSPARIVDPGAGSGRFLIAAARAFPQAALVAIEMDPLAALLLRANLGVLGYARRATVRVEDYRQTTLPACDGMTAFIGNPPYVRHHDIAEPWKRWYAQRFAELGIKASALAGLHLHFFLQTQRLARCGDVGAFITSAEWLDVNYGSALRRLYLEALGGVSLHVLKPTVEAFPGTASTASIACFRVGEVEQPLLVRSVSSVAGLGTLNQGSLVSRAQLRTERRWSGVIRPQAPPADGAIELGELFKVHRGQVTGANDIWIAGEHAVGLPDRVKLPAVTKAKDLIEAGSSLQSPTALRRVIDLPPDLAEFDADERQRIADFLSWAQARGVHRGYIAQHRKAWWSVGMKAPAPILCTYMARRPPQFTLNTCQARHINIAHGLYPRLPIAAHLLPALVAWLNTNVSTGAGRTYSGGLTKFEPKEIERLHIPRLEALVA